MRVFDADTHALEPMEMWQEYVEPRHRADAPRMIFDENNVERMVVGGKIMNPGPFMLGAIGSPGGLADATKARSTPYAQAHPGGWDATRRLADMDAEGVTKTAIYTSVGLFFGGDEDPVVMAALCRAYNSWISDHCKQAPERLFALAIVPLMDIEAAIVEARRAVEQLGLKGIMLRPNPYNGRMLHDPAYDPFWREVQRLGVPVCLHEGATGNIPFAGSERCRNNPGAEDPAALAFAFSHIICHPHEQEIAAMQLICGGVLEKFPTLKVAFMESGAGWMAYWLHRMDEHYEALPSFLPALKRPPSDYFKRQCWIATEGEEFDMATVLRYLGEDRVVWASDYPHFDCKLPGMLAWTKHTDLPQSVLEKLLWKNASALYGC
jgi:uncharacterized protein